MTARTPTAQLSVKAPVTAKPEFEQLAQALGALTEGIAEIHTFLANCPPLVDVKDAPKTNFLFPKFKEDSPDIQGLVEFLWSKAINYVVPLHKRRAALRQAQAQNGGGDLSPFVRLLEETRRAFISFNQKYPGRASEVGELLAYCLALAYLDAAQIASKMALKTSGNMPVHGVDGVHARFHDGVMTLYFLESKLRASATDGISSFADSVSKFANNRKQYLIEYSIIHDFSNLDALPESEKALALEYLDVYGPRREQRLERSVGVICYSEKKHFSKKLASGDDTPPRLHEEHFCKNYRSEHELHRDALKHHLAKGGIAFGTCHAYFVAVPDVDEMRTLFYEVMNGSD